MKSILGPGALFLIVLAGGLFYHFHSLNKQQEDLSLRLEDFKEELYNTERFYIENLPIYEDWSDTQKESNLRRFLLKDHLRVVEEAGLQPVSSAEMIQSMDQNGQLVSLEQDQSTPYYFYNVKKEHRYLHPDAQKGLFLLAERFQKVLHRNLDGKDQFKPLVVKFAISSALRPVAYQRDLRKSNANASFVSSHSYGLSFDLFYDSFYVNLREPETVEGSIPAALDNLRLRSGFLLGASLRRQFRAALAETLLQLQEEGLLYAIYERNQRCYHVTIRPDAIK